MQGKLIEPGKVYAYIEDEDYEDTRQIVFFEPVTKDNLYLNPRNAGNVSNHFRRINAQRPSKGDGFFYSSIGYIAAIGRDVTGASLEEALEVGTLIREDKSYKYTVITSIRYVHGPDFATYAAQIREKQEIRRKTRHAENLRIRNNRDKLETYRQQLSVFGISGRIEYSTETGQYRMSFNAAVVATFIDALDNIR